MSTPDDAPRIGNRYRLEQRIGAGAMGAVWRGTDELLNRTVAVKELLAAAEPPTAAGGDALEESRQRLMREGRIGARLQHPHVISMFDVVVHDDRPWLVMEYLPSKSLAAMLAEKGPMEPRVVAEIGRQVADGLAAAHAAGVVHRDVKPGNVLIAEDGRVKLTDFGVSRAVDDVQLTRTGLIAGTPAFLSPEVARGKEPTAASDVFALGATLYAAVEGHPPFGLDDNAYALLHKVATGAPEPPRQAGALTALVMRLLSDDPTERPTASEARDTLAAVAEGRSTTGGAVATGTAVLDAGAVAAVANGGRTAVAYRDARPADHPADAPELVATAAAVPPVTTAPPPPADPGDRGTPDTPGGPRRGPVLLALLALAVVGIGILAAVLTRGGNAPTSGVPSATATSTAAAAPAPVVTRAAPTTEAAPTTTASQTSTEAPTSTTESTPTTSAEPAATGDPVAFVQSYYGMLPGNTDAAWALLGPTAQSQSGGRDGFNSFYAGLARVWAENLRVTGNTVSATIVFTQKNGAVSREAYQFVIGTQNGRQVIESFSH
jgi:eukaryotic-like serine/threonine-protein kinase